MSYKKIMTKKSNHPIYNHLDAFLGKSPNDSGYYVMYDGKTKTISVRCADGYKPIVCWDTDNTILLSNRTTRLSGITLNMHATEVIESTLVELIAKDINFKMVDGLAIPGSKVVDIPPSHKTMWGIIKAFGNYSEKKLYHEWLWYGTPPKVFIETKKRDDGDRFVSYLKHIDGTIIATRHTDGNKERWYSAKSCRDKDTFLCDTICPAKFTCLTQTDIYDGNIFYINRDIIYHPDLVGISEYISRYLHPSAIIDLSLIRDISKSVKELDEEDRVLRVIKDEESSRIEAIELERGLFG